jgi:uncharacterized protein (TIGR00288 family)
MATNSHHSDVAVFIDFENVYVSTRDKLDANPNFEAIMDRCEDFGRVVIARAYADWYRYPRVTSALYANAIEPMYVPTYYYDRDLGRTGRAIKNSVDMNLCIDAMKTLFTNPNIEKFVLCTGDRDFIPLVNSIRQQGKEVVIIGIGGAASSHLAQSADEFIFYETLIGKKADTLHQDQPRAKMPEKGRESEPEERPAPPAQAAREPAPQSPSEDIYDVLVRAVHLARERDFVCSFGSLKLLMKELMGGEFREDRYRDSSGRPFAKFKDFVLEAERRGKVNVFTSGAMNEVFLPGEDPYKLSRFALDLKEEPPAPEAARQESPEEHDQSRQASQAGAGRRRRRRSRSGRSQAANGVEPVTNGEASEDLEELELSFGDEGEGEEGSAPEAVDDRFEELLDRLGLEQSQREALELPEVEPPLADDQAPPVEDEPAVEEAVVIDETPAEPVAAVELELPQPEAGEDAMADTTAPSIAPVFNAEEWAFFQRLMEQNERPLSFAQLHDVLRNARKGAGINRTNEELRTMIKQAINTGVLARSGRGGRVVYRYVQPDVSEVLIDAEPPAEQPVTIDELPTPKPTVVEAAPAEVAQAEAPVAEQPEAKRSRARRKPAAEAAAEQPVAEAKPATRSRARRKPDAETAAEQPVAEAEASSTPEEAAPKPATRRRRRTTKAAETQDEG